MKIHKKLRGKLFKSITLFAGIVLVLNMSMAGVFFVADITSATSDSPTEQEKCELTLTKTGPATTTPGAEITYNLKLENTGNVICTGGGVQLYDYFPAGVTYSGEYDFNGTFNNALLRNFAGNYAGLYGTCTDPNKCTGWNFGHIENGRTIEVNLRMKVDNDVPCGSELVNKASFRADTYYYAQDSKGDYKYIGGDIATTTVECLPQYGSISGYKYEDADGMASTTDDWTGLEGWTINLLDSASTTIATTTTNGDGYYEFSDLPLNQNYYLTEKMESGWYQLSAPNNPVYLATSTASDTASSTNNNFVNSRLGSISGHKYEDADGMASTTDDRVGVEGWAIDLFSLTPKVELIAGTSTGPNGYYEFNNLPLGSYRLVETMPRGQGWYQVEAPDIVVLSSTTTDSTDNNFINSRLGSISGHKYEDKDGAADTEDWTGLEGWTINLLDSASTTIASTTTAGDNGYYEFTALPLGVYYLTEEMKAGWEQLSAPKDPIILKSDLDSGTASSTDNNFVNYRYPELGSISGHKYEDMDGMVGTPNDRYGLDNWIINLLDGSTGNFIASTTTGYNADSKSHGYYEFKDLPFGDYVLTEDMKPGWIQLDAPPAITLNATITDSAGNDFVNSKPGFISGYKYKDDDGLLSTTGDRSGLPNWYISLYASTSAGVKMSATTVTGDDGYFEFKNLPLGVYILTEDMKSGWNQLYAPPEITLTAAATSSTDNNFVNYYPESGGPEYGYLKICKYVDEDGVLDTTEDQEPVGGWEFIVDSGIAASSYRTLPLDQEGGGCTESIKLETGDYDISETLGKGWYSIEPISGSMTATVEFGKTTTVNFYNTQYGSISGYKYNDLNNNGKIDANETGISGWEIQLIGCPYAPLQTGASTFLPKNRINLDPAPDETGYCSVIATTTTGVNGFYTFDYLRSGDYGVSEASRNDWTQTYPEDQGFYYFNLGKGEATTTVNFLNHYEKPPVCGDGIVNQETEQCDGNDGIGENQTCTSDCLIEDVPYCGDDVCDTDGGENCSTCVSDCGGCGGGSVIIISGGPEPPIVLGEEGEPMLSIDKTVNMKFANPGDEIEYKVVVANNGNLTAFDAVLDDTLPDGFTFSDDGAATRTVNVGDIKSGEIKTFNFAVTIGDNVAPGNYTNIATVSASNHDPVSDSADIEVRAIEVLGVELAETGFSVKEFVLLVAVILGLYGLALILRRKYGLNE